MRLKNQKAEHDRYVAMEKQVYNTIVTWIKGHINEQTKSKMKIIQGKLLDFFKQNSKPTSIQVLALLTTLKNQYLPNGLTNNPYDDISLLLQIINTLDNDTTLYFDIYVDFNGIYRRRLIQSNQYPNIDGKPQILDIEITKDELADKVKEIAITEGGFEEI